MTQMPAPHDTNARATGAGSAMRVVLLLSSAHLLGDFYAAFYAPLVPYLREQFHLSLTMTGGLAALYMTVSNFLQPIFGMMGEQFGRRRVLAAGVLLSTLGMSAVALSGSMAGLWIALIVGGVGVGMFHPCGAALAGGGEPRVRFRSLSWYMVGGNLGVMLAPAVVPLLAGWDVRAVALLAVPGILFALYLGLRLPVEVLNPARAVSTHVAETVRVFRKIWPIYVDVVLRFTTLQIYAVLLPLYATLEGYSRQEAGLTLAFFMLAGAAGVVGGGFVAHRVGHRKLVVFTELGGGVCLMLAPGLSGWARYALLGIGSALAYGSTPLQLAAAQRLAPRTEGAASGIVMGLAYGMCSLLLLPLGRLGDHLTATFGSERLAVGALLQWGAIAMFVAAICAMVIPLERMEAREG